MTLKAKPGTSDERSVRTSLHPQRQRYSHELWPSEVTGGVAIASLHVL